MKNLFIVPILALFFLLGGMTTASAHCGMCETNEQHKMEKPCAKCAEAGKPCMCSKKASGDKVKICEMKDHNHGHKPCKMCAESEHKYQMKKKRSEIFFND